MSLRPSEREQMRKGNCKQTADAEESRRRREGQMVNIHKAKRQESLQKKRRERFPASAAGAVPPMGRSTMLQQKICADYGHQPPAMTFRPSYHYSFHTDDWNMVYKHTVDKNFKVKPGYDSEVRVGWASLWVSNNFMLHGINQDFMVSQLSKDQSKGP